MSRHQNGCTLRFLIYFCSGFNQKNFESALLSLRGWKMTFLKVDFNHFDRIFIENCKNDFVLIDLLFPWNLVNKKVNFHTLKLKSALLNFFWLEPLQIHIRNCKNQPFWCRDNSAILGQNLLFLTPIFDWFLEIFGIFFSPKHQFRYIFSYKINSKFENRF